MVDALAEKKSGLREEASYLIEAFKSDSMLSLATPLLISNLVLAIAGDRTQDKIINSDLLYRWATVAFRILLN